jgi:hypothetical protein
MGETLPNMSHDVSHFHGEWEPFPWVQDYHKYTTSSHTHTPSVNQPSLTSNAVALTRISDCIELSGYQAVSTHGHSEPQSAHRPPPLPQLDPWADRVTAMLNFILDVM